MVKRTYQRKQRGGDWYNPASWFSSTPSDPNAPPKKSWSEWWSDTTGSAEASLASASESVSSGAQNMVSSANEYLSQNVDLTGQQEVPNQIQVQQNNSNQSPIGGRKSRSKSKSKSYKGGKGLSITYYATPVTDMKTAQPNYWIKGGKKGKKSKRKSSSKKSKKTRRYKSRSNYRK